MTVELPEELDRAIEQQATVHGLSPADYVREVMEHQVQVSSGAKKPLKSGLGLWKKYNISLSAEDIDENRRDMLRGSIFDPEVQ